MIGTTDRRQPTSEATNRGSTWEIISRLYFTLFRLRSRDPAPRGYLLQPATRVSSFPLGADVAGRSVGARAVTPLLKRPSLSAILDTDKSCPSFFSTRAILPYPLPLRNPVPLFRSTPFLLPSSFNGHGRYRASRRTRPATTISHRHRPDFSSGASFISRFHP